MSTDVQAERHTSQPRPRGRLVSLGVRGIGVHLPAFGWTRQRQYWPWCGAARCGLMTIIRSSEGILKLITLD